MRVDERDARENRRREGQVRDIATLPVHQRDAAQHVENDLIRKYEMDKELLMAAKKGTVLSESSGASGITAMPRIADDSLAVDEGLATEATTSEILRSGVQV